MNTENILHRGAVFEEIGIQQLKFYWITALFTLANVVLPVMLHQLPMGGRMFLPLYFFTLIAGYRFGWKAGVTTALTSALVSFTLTGMPPLLVLPFVLFKGALLGISAGIIARVSKLPLLLNLCCVVVVYQFFGSLFEWWVLRDMTLVLSDITTGYFGLALQIFGGTLALNAGEKIWKKNH